MKASSSEASTAGTPQDQYVNVQGVNTRYWAEGSAGSPVVLIHGIGGYAESWLPSFGALATEHRVYAFDLIGQGRTDKPLDVSYTIEALSQFVRDFMTSVRVERAHVVGHSLGGAIATRLALMYPEAVDRLVLVASAGLGKEIHVMFRLLGVPIVGEFLVRPSRSGSAKFLKQLVYDESLVDNEMIELDYGMSCLPGAQKAFLKILRGCGNPIVGQGESICGPNVRGLGTITIPVLVVWGHQDEILPVAHAEFAAKRLPNVTIKLFDQCGHVPMLEYSREFNAMLLDFLATKAVGSATVA